MYVYTSILVPPVPVGILVTQRLGWAAHDSWTQSIHVVHLCLCFRTAFECSDSIRPASKSLSLSITTRAPEAKRHSPVASWARACASCPVGETCLGPTSCGRWGPPLLNARAISFSSHSVEGTRALRHAHTWGVPACSGRAAGRRVAPRVHDICAYMCGGLRHTPPPGTGGRAPRLGHIGRDGAWVGVRARPR